MITISNNELRELPDYPILPGESLKEALEVIGMSQKELASRMGRPIKTINEIIHGKAVITAETALQLEKVLGVTSKFWLNLEANYQIIKAQNEASKKMAQEIRYVSKFPYSQMANLGWVKKAKDKYKKASELLRYFGVVSFSNLKIVKGISYRKDAKKKASPEALTAWLRRGEILAQTLQIDDYNRAKFIEILGEIKSLTRNMTSNFSRNLQEMCADCGVALVFVPHLAKTYVHGATRWLKPKKALIQLTIRYKRTDIFWFTFFHEAAHIILHGKSEKFIDIEEQAHTEQEEDANDWASNFLINESAYKKFISNNKLTLPDIAEFAKTQNVSLEIVIGRLLHDRILFNYPKWSKYLPKLEWRINT